MAAATAPTAAASNPPAPVRTTRRASTRSKARLSIPPECTVTYTKNILPKIRDQWRCGAGGCHSAPLATGATTVFDTTNADTTYAKLTTTVHGGKKLVDTTSAAPADSAIYCLMQGTCGERMPRQGVDPLDLALVETWLKCKAPRGTAD